MGRNAHTRAIFVRIALLSPLCYVGFNHFLCLLTINFLANKQVRLKTFEAKINQI